MESDGVNKTESQLKQEDTFIFITGHSLGGAVANCLSVSDYITSLVNENENRIYTYTFEAPHTCVNLWWMDVAGMSNAYNYKNSNDIVTYLPPYFGSTTYGKDVEFSVAELNYGVFDTLFPDAEGDSFDALGGVENLHQIALDLVYIIQQGINEGYWDSVDDVIADESETTQTETVLNIETGEFNEETFNTSGIMQWEDFASTYPAIVDSYGFSGDYTEKMNIALFELQDDDGNLLEEKALFNPTGFGDDPFEWGKEYGGVTYQSSEEFEADEFYIRYQEIVAVGSADGDRFIYVINESANESTSQYDGYAGIVASMIEQYGALHFIEDEYGSECYAAGLIYAGLVDFDADGLDELFIVHTDPQDQNSCHPVAEVYATGEGASGNNVPTQNFYGKLRDISYEATCTFDLVQQDGKIYLPTMSLESGITSLYGFTSAGSGTYDSVREFSGNEFYDQKTSGAYADYLSIPYYVAARPEEGYEERKNDMEQTLTSAMNEILSTLGVE